MSHCDTIDIFLTMKIIIVIDNGLKMKHVYLQPHEYSKLSNIGPYMHCIFYECQRYGIGNHMIAQALAGKLLPYVQYIPWHMYLVLYLYVVVFWVGILPIRQGIVWLHTSWDVLCVCQQCNSKTVFSPKFNMMSSIQYSILWFDVIHNTRIDTYYYYVSIVALWITFSCLYFLHEY